MSWRVVFSRQAQKDARKLASASPALKQRAQDLIVLLVGDLRGAYSRRINIQHRIVYSVEADQQLVKGLRLWSHYD